MERSSVLGRRDSLSSARVLKVEICKIMSNRNKKLALVVQMVNVIIGDDSSSSSASSSDSDDEADQNDLLVLYNTLILETNRDDYEVVPKVTDYVERTVPGASRNHFKNDYRMFPETFEAVLRVIAPGLAAVGEQGGRQSIDPQKQLLIALWFMATPDSYRSVSSRFGVGKATAFRAVRRVTYSLYCCAKRFIKWPKTHDEVEKTVDKFKKKKSFPGVIGALDGCHIPIRAPKEDPASYYNRKKFFSIVLQGVCDARRMFTHCYVGPAGSVHDARVFRNSPVARFLTLPAEYFPNNTHLIADSAYALSTHVMTPFKDNGHLTRRQRNYNYRLSATRMAIEHTFGLMKARFRILMDCLPLTDVRKIPEFVIACCVLHNICMLNDDLFEVNFPDVPAEQAEGIVQAGIDEGGRVKQTRIMLELPLRAAHVIQI